MLLSLGLLVGTICQSNKLKIVLPAKEATTPLGSQLHSSQAG